MHANSSRLLALALGLAATPGFAAPAKAPKPAPAAKPAPAPKPAAVTPKKPANGLSLLSGPPNLAARLQITPEQKAKFSELQAKLQTEMQALYGKDNQILPEKFQQITRSKARAEEEAEALLTPTQKKEFDVVSQDYASFDGLGASAARLISVSNLSADQKTRIKNLANETRTKRSGIVLSLGKGEDQKEIGKRLQAMETDVQEGIKKILTSTQQKTFDNAFLMTPPKSGEKPAPAKPSDKPAPGKTGDKPNAPK